MADWIPSLAVLAAFTPAVVLIALTPGPDMTLFLAKTLGQSRAAGLAAMSGAVTGLVVHALFAAFGLSALLAASETAFMTVKIAGAGYLLWLAFEAIRHGSAFTADHDGSRRQRLGEIYVTGLGINLLNPKIVLFFITFLPQFVATADPQAAAKLMFLGIYFIAVSAPICVALILFADRVAAGLRRSPRIMRAFDYVFAGIMGAFALRLLVARGS
jgi:threonine/homoserine/homoserine lactone efflux protein